MGEQHAATIRRAPVVFVSYRREDAEAVSILDVHLRARGLDVWRDVRNHKLGNNSEDILTAIQTCDAFLLYVTNDLLEDQNSFVWRREAPEALKRQGNQLAIIPVFHGVSTELARAKLAAMNLQDIVKPNGLKVSDQGKELSQESLNKIADRTLSDLLSIQLADRLPDDEIWIKFGAAPLAPHLPHEIDIAVDWADFFQSGYPSSADWQNVLVPAAVSIPQALIGARVSQSVHIVPRARYSAAVTLGFAFREITGFTLHLERFENNRQQTWSITPQAARATPKSSFLVRKGPSIEPTPGVYTILNPESRDAVVEVAATRLIHAQVDDYLKGLALAPRFHVILAHPELSKEQPLNQASVTDEEMARHIAQDVMSEVVRLQAEGSTCIHLFISAPHEVAFFIGYLSNKKGPILVYDYEQADGMPHYILGPTVGQ